MVNVVTLIRLDNNDTYLSINNQYRPSPMYPYKSDLIYLVNALDKTSHPECVSRSYRRLPD